MSSKRNLRRRACEGKKRFASAVEARAASWKSMESYRCEFCGSWHNGHRTAAAQRVIMQRRSQPGRLS